MHSILACCKPSCRCSCPAARSSIMHWAKRHSQSHSPHSLQDIPDAEHRGVHSQADYTHRQCICCTFKSMNQRPAKLTFATNMSQETFTITVSALVSVAGTEPSPKATSTFGNIYSGTVNGQPGLVDITYDDTISSSQVTDGRSVVCTPQCMRAH